MHELSIAQALAATALDHARAAGSQRVRALTVEVGTLTGVEPALLQAAFPAVATGILAGARLDLIAVPARCRCLDCGEFAVGADGLRCPTCGTPAAEVLCGRELHLTSLEID
jgi:hydrogenase nickel incorporation protein HypA/HybF